MLPAEDSELLGVDSSIHCWACGRADGLASLGTLYHPELAAGHGFSASIAKNYDDREGLICVSCGSNRRSWHIAKTLTELFGEGECRSLPDLCRQISFSDLTIAEMNQCAQLHRFFIGLPHLIYSEFGSTDPQVPHEDALNLSYPHHSIDLMLTSDTLEHVPDVQRALSEIHRVLKPGGLHIFTIPVVWDRWETKQRAIIEDGKIKHLITPPCYHGGSLNPEDCLAFYEYGRDVSDIVAASGFGVDVRQCTSNAAIATFVTRSK